MTSARERAAGVLYGLALGDALGAVTEFMAFDAIVRRFGPEGPPEPRGNPARVTDDTQMALAVGEALMAQADSELPLDAASLEPPLRQAFVDWYRSPDNNRAPGGTCLQACEGLQRGGSWVEATVAGSKGCGANMRVAPVGLLALRGVDAVTRAGVAQLQAALTHGHPTALAASDLTAFAVAELAAGSAPNTLLDRMTDYATSQTCVHHAEWLSELWQRPGMDTPESYIARGWDECLAILQRVERGLPKYKPGTDPCDYTGGGWIAEEALATALLCFLASPDDAVQVIRRAAATSGDSDSIACVAGALVGAHMGIGAWPNEWANRIEYRHRLDLLVTFFGGNP